MIIVYLLCKNFLLWWATSTKWSAKLWNINLAKPISYIHHKTIFRQGISRLTNIGKTYCVVDFTKTFSFRAGDIAIFSIFSYFGKTDLAAKQTNKHKKNVDYSSSLPGV